MAITRPGPSIRALPLQLSWALGLGVACAGLVASDGCVGWERDVFDVLSRVAVPRGGSSQDVSIVLIDENTLDWGIEFFEVSGGEGDDGPTRTQFVYPWNRAVYEMLIHYLAECGADVVALDVELAGPHPSGDGMGEAGLGCETSEQNKLGRPYVVHTLNFETAAERQSEVARLGALQQECLSGAAVAVAGWSSDGMPFDRSDVGPYSNPILPYRSILHAFEQAPGLLRLGAVTVQPDTDGVIRRARVIVAWDGRCYPSLGLAAALARLETREGPVALTVDQGDLVLETAVATRSLPLTPSGDLLIRWSDSGREDLGDPLAARFPTYPAHRVLRSAMHASAIELEGESSAVVQGPDDYYYLGPEAFAGRIVFLGSNATGLRDLKATPISEDYPGVKIHAAVAEAALSGDAMRRAASWLRAAVAACVTALTALVTFRAGSQALRLALVGLIGLAAVGASAIAFVEVGVWWDIVTPVLGMGIAYAAATTVNHLTEGRRSRVIAGLFQHFAPAEVVRKLIDHPEDLALEGETREITAFFSDIRGFTGLANTPRMVADPGLLTSHLNAYLTEMTRAITDCGGTVDKYIGDAVVAIFGAPLPLGDHAGAACRAALLCQQVVADFNVQATAAGLPEFVTRIGLYSGNATLGLIGSEHRLSYTAIGSTVNLASRMEGVNKTYGTWVLAGKRTRELASAGVVMRLIDKVRVPGIADGMEPLEVYEVLAAEGLDSPGNPSVVDFLQEFEAARGLYASRRFGDATVAFEQLLVRRDDAPCRVLLDRCRAWSHSPPHAGWDGSHRIEGK